MMTQPFAADVSRASSSRGGWLRTSMTSWRWWPESGAASPIPALDGLRAMAVLLVFVYHAWDLWPGYIQPGQSPFDYPINIGRFGVHLFFVLSGFLLFLPYARWLVGMGRRPAARLFYLRRALRVGPAYWACLLILAIAEPLDATSGIAGRVGDVALHAVFLSNLTPATLLSINGLFWTMAIEVQFYVLLPLLALGFAVAVGRLGLARGVSCGVLVLILVSCAFLVLTRWAAGHQLPGPVRPLGFLTAEYGCTPFWLDIFGLGMGLSVIYVWLTQATPASQVKWTSVRWAGWAALAIGAALLLALAVLPFVHHLPLKDLIAGLGFTLVLAGVLFGPTAAGRVFAWRPLRFLGLISYSFYLWHNILMWAIGSRLPTTPGSPGGVVVRAALIFPVALLVAYLSYQLVERPFLASRQRVRDAELAERQKTLGALRISA